MCLEFNNCLMLIAENFMVLSRAIFLYSWSLVGIMMSDCLLSASSAEMRVLPLPDTVPQASGLPVRSPEPEAEPGTAEEVRDVQVTLPRAGGNQQPARQRVIPEPEIRGLLLMGCCECVVSCLLVGFAMIWH